MNAEQMKAIKECLSYDPESGDFTWIKKTGRSVVVGSKAGSLNPLGYIEVGVIKTKIFAHRLAWVWVYGSIDSRFIDHIDGDRSNNRIANLRLVDQKVNMQNQKKCHVGNSSGFLGVCFDKKKDKYIAQIYANGKNKRIGIYDTAELAHEAYLTVKRKLHEGCVI